MFGSYEPRIRLFFSQTKRGNGRLRDRVADLGARDQLRLARGIAHIEHPNDIVLVCTDTDDAAHATTIRARPAGPSGLRNRWRRCGSIQRLLPQARLQQFLSEQLPCVMAIEACTTSHFWGQLAQSRGHDVRLIAPIHVKPFVKLRSSSS